MYKLSKRSLSRLEKVNPILIAIFVDAVRECPYDFGIPNNGGYRTKADQNLLYRRGVSQKDGYLKKSYHQSGNAIDIYAYINGVASWNKDILEDISKHVRKIATERYNISLIWGGDWDNDGIRVDNDNDESFFDGGHFQIL